ncbi:hypothetical protein Ahia01_000904600, partial [Argonauta hians]
KQSDEMSPRCSPKKGTGPPSSTTTSSSSSSSSKLSPPPHILRSLLSTTGPDMSAFRLLYNLEVLSGKLMPTGEEVGVCHSGRRFCEDFLQAGGLALVMHILQPEAMATDVPYAIRQAAYSISLQLTRFLLCGQTVTGEVYVPPSPLVRPSPPPGASCLGNVGTVESSVGAGSRALQ